MLAVYCTHPDPENPLAAVRVGSRPRPTPPQGWVSVRMHTASLNMREVNVLAGRCGVGQRYPVTLGSDGCGVLTDGTEVLVHSSVPSAGWRGPEILDPGRSVLSAHHDGTFAEYAVVPQGNVVPRPAQLSAIEAACLPTAWLTAYRMVFVTAAAQAGATILVRGRSRLGTIASAAIALAHAAGIRVWTAGPEQDHALALSLGADACFTDSRDLPAPVAAVLDASVSGAGWLDDVSAVQPHGAIVCAGYRAQGGQLPDTSAQAMHDLVFREIRVQGSGMGTVDDLRALVDFLVATGLRPTVAHEFDVHEVRQGMRTMLSGTTVGKIVFRL